MKKYLYLPIKAFSINQMTGRDVRHKTKAYKNWCYRVFEQLNTDDNQKSLKDLREFFNEEKHAYVIHMTTYYPESDLITHKNTLSAKAFDTTNVEKPLVDLLFDPVFSKKDPPFGCCNLQSNDKYLLDMYSKKRIAESHKIELIIEIVEKDLLLKDHIVNN